MFDEIVGMVCFLIASAFVILTLWHVYWLCWLHCRTLPKVPESYTVDTLISQLRERDEQLREVTLSYVNDMVVIEADLERYKHEYNAERACNDSRKGYR